MFSPSYSSTETQLEYDVLCRSGVEDVFSDDEEECLLEEVEVKTAEAASERGGKKRAAKELSQTSPKKKAKKEKKIPESSKTSPKAGAKKKTAPKEAATSSGSLTHAAPKASLSKNVLLKESKEQTLKRVRQELEACMKEGKQEDPEKEAARQRQIKDKKETPANVTLFFHSVFCFHVRVIHRKNDMQAVLEKVKPVA